MPDTAFSAIGTVAVTATGSLSLAAAMTASITAAAPPMSDFISRHHRRA